MSDALPSKTVTLPGWMECSEKDERGETLTALERFILDNEPAGVADEIAFLAGLAAVLQEERAKQGETDGDARRTADYWKGELHAANAENKRLREQMGEIAVLLLQNDRNEVMEWARGVKVHFPDGKPELVALKAEATPIQCVFRTGCVNGQKCIDAGYCTHGAEMQQSMSNAQKTNLKPVDEIAGDRDTSWDRP